MPLTAEQLNALRAVPLGSMANKVRLARMLLAADVRQSDIGASSGLTKVQISDIERGEYKDIPLENCRGLAEFFGCQIEDLFPPRAAAQ